MTFEISAISFMPIVPAAFSSHMNAIVTLCSSRFEVPFQTAVLFSALGFAF